MERTFLKKAGKDKTILLFFMFGYGFFGDPNKLFTYILWGMAL